MTADVVSAPRDRLKSALFTVWYLTGRKSRFTGKEVKEACRRQSTLKRLDLEDFLSRTTGYTSFDSLTSIMRRRMVDFDLLVHVSREPFELKQGVVTELEAMAMTEINPLLLDAVMPNQAPAAESDDVDEEAAPPASQQVVEPIADTDANDEDDLDDEPDPASDEPFQVDSLEAAVMLFCSPGMTRWVQNENGGTKQWKLRLRNEFPAATPFLDMLLEYGILIKVGLKESEQVYQIQPEMIGRLVPCGKLEAWAWEQFQAERATPPQDGVEELGIPLLSTFDEAIKKATRLRAESRAEIKRYRTVDACKAQIAELQRQVALLEEEIQTVEVLGTREMFIEPLPRLFRQGRRQVELRLKEQERKVLEQLKDKLTFGARQLNKSPAELLLMLSHDLTCVSEAKT